MQLWGTGSLADAIASICPRELWEIVARPPDEAIRKRAERTCYSRCWIGRCLVDRVTSLAHVPSLYTSTYFLSLSLFLMYQVSRSI